MFTIFSNKNANASGNKKIIAVLVFLIAAFAVIYFALRPSFEQTKQAQKITNFQECAAAGYRVMESYPRECTMPSGQFFVEQNVQIK
jgi:hypothetical protein